MGKQKPLFEQLSKTDRKCFDKRAGHGGELKKDFRARKHHRPLAKNKWIHLILRSDHAKGPKSLMKHSNMIEKLLRTYGRKWGVEVKEPVILSNHLHVRIRLKFQKSFSRFIKTVTALIARKIMKTEKGQPAKVKFWTHRPFTRVLYSFKELKILTRYFELNKIELYWGTETRELAQRIGLRLRSERGRMVLE